MMKNILLFALILGLLTATGCKKKDPCEEEWPEGFEFYETTNGDEEPNCTTPILIGWYKHNANGPHYNYNMKLTPQQGVAEIQLTGPTFGHFKTPVSYTLNTGNVSNDANQMFISVNQQWNSESGLYWWALSGSATIHSVDTVAGTTSLTVEYEIAPVGKDDEKQIYRMELDDYPLPWNPN